MIFLDSLLQDKSETHGIIKKFIRRAYNEYELKIKNIRSDNGSEFWNINVEEFLNEEGIKDEFSTPYTPQQNSTVERKNRTLIEAARTMLDEYKTLDIFWAKQSTRLAMLSTASTSTNTWARHPTR
jgi:transposase InsO family protein